MNRIHHSPLVSIVALAVACFSTGFSVTAAAYIGRSQHGTVTTPAGATNVAGTYGRTCDQRVATR